MKIGDKVRVVNRTGLDPEWHGYTGTLVGFSTPQGYAKVLLDDPPSGLPSAALGVVLVHPEGLEEVTE